jgi:hypothetical protein
VSRQNLQKEFFQEFSGFSVLLDTPFLLQQKATTSSDTSGSFSCHEQERTAQKWFSQELMQVGLDSCHQKCFSASDRSSIDCCAHHSQYH